MSEGESFLTRWSRLKRKQGEGDALSDVPRPPEQASQPLEMTQAELRDAWRSDPAVRDFVEMADNQWDFNVPDAIPGFGSLGAVEEAHALLVRAATTADNPAATLASLTPSSGSPGSQEKTDGPLADSRVVDPVWQVGGTSGVEAAPVAMLEKRLEPDSPEPNRRLHGSAMPK